MGDKHVCEEEVVQTILLPMKDSFVPFARHQLEQRTEFYGSEQAVSLGPIIFNGHFLDLTVIILKMN